MRFAVRPLQAMAACCLASSLRHCPSAAAHQMVSLLVRQRGGAAAAATALLLPPLPSPPQQQQPQHQPGATPLFPLRCGTSGGGAPAGVSHHAGGSGGGGAAAGGAVEHQPLCVSLAHARRALEMDLEDGYSWCESLRCKASLLLHPYQPAQFVRCSMSMPSQYEGWCERCCCVAGLTLHSDTDSTCTQASGPWTPWLGG